jgi:hypothetical protein
MAALWPIKQDLILKTRGKEMLLEDLEELKTQEALLKVVSWETKACSRTRQI